MTSPPGREEEDRELKNGIRRDHVRDALVAVSEVRSNTDQTRTTHPHALDSVLEASYDASLSEPKAVTPILADYLPSIQAKGVPNFNRGATCYGVAATLR
jgi:hypothetical protein